MEDKQIIIKRIRDCDNCKFRPETSKVCSDYENCYMVSEYIVNLREQLKAKEQECEKAKQVVLQALKDFSIEVGTPQYDRLLNSAKELGIEVKDYE